MKDRRNNSKLSNNDRKQTLSILNSVSVRDSIENHSRLKDKSESRLESFLLERRIERKR